MGWCSTFIESQRRYIIEGCVFCDIVTGTSPSHKIWEDDSFLAFLSIFPNTEGVTVVITKDHYPSYAFDLPEEILKELIIASKKVAKLLDSKLVDVARTALVFEGYGVNHIHTKLFPMHGTADLTVWKPLHSKMTTYFEKYPGYISSHDSERADDKKLAQLAKKIRSEE